MPEVEQQRRMYRSRSERVVAGVSGGIAEHLGVDPVLVRLSFVALAFAGIGVALYIIAWIVIPEAPAGHEPRPASEAAAGSYSARLVAGTVLVALGVLLLLDVLLPIRKVVWPLALIVVGLAVFAYGTRR